MKILVVGGGGREHALVWKLAQSPRVKKIYCAPGNAGISMMAECLPISVNDIGGLVSFAKNQRIDLTIVGPELPLTMGIVDIFKENHLKIFGPTRGASRLEASKFFCKEFCKRHNIRTAKSQIFTDIESAKSYIEKQQYPLVIKVDGLAQGKGVFICKNVGDSISALEDIMINRVFDDAGKAVIVEEFLNGEEASFIAITDGETIMPLATSQDHKRVFDDDLGPNTGGMGAYSPAPIVTDELHKRVMIEVMIPIIRGMAKEGHPYVGVLYAGLMIKDGDSYLLEINCRFGDPETEPIMMRFKSDLLEVIEASISGTLNRASIEWDLRPAVSVVMASKGYPGSYEKGKVISGLNDVEHIKDVVVFHAGTMKRDHDIVTNGGRVLDVTALGEDIETAMNNVYHAVEKISWDGAHYRKDIGRRALLRNP